MNFEMNKIEKKEKQKFQQKLTQSLNVEIVTVYNRSYNFFLHNRKISNIHCKVIESAEFMH